MAVMLVELTAAEPQALSRVGGKAAGLAALAQIGGCRVPEAICLGAEALELHLQGCGAAPPPAGLSHTEAGWAELRAAIEAAPLPTVVEAELGAWLQARGPEVAWALRSSASCEDQAQASFAGLFETRLGLMGPAEVLGQLRQIWSSLYSERARRYAQRQGMALEHLRMAVVVQRMVEPRTSGILFTADPRSGDRRVSAVEAVEGLAEGLVSGRESAEGWRICGGRVIERRGAGRALLSEAELLELEALGRRVEAALGQPQDLEWCLDAAGLCLVQSRPITTLYPVPASEEPGLRIYLSVGHQQMMTEAMRPLGLSVFQALAARPMWAAGGRLFVDVTAELQSPARRGPMLALMGRADPLTRDALEQVLVRGLLPEAPAAPPMGPPPAPAEVGLDVVPGLIAAAEDRAREAEARLVGRGLALWEAVGADLQSLKRELADPPVMGVIFAGMRAAAWLDEHLGRWLGEVGAVDPLSKGSPHNTTAEMGLALLELADQIRPHPAVVDWLAAGGAPWTGLAGLPGGGEVEAAMGAFLSRWGSRCPGEIDLTRPRWGERPEELAPILLGLVRGLPPGEAARRREQGLREAKERAKGLLARLRAGPEGAARSAEVQAMITRLRAFTGYREQPKAVMMRRFALWRAALLRLAAELGEGGLLQEAEDMDFLTFEELGLLLRGGALEPGLVARRRAEHAQNQRRRPPRLLSSTGEVLEGSHRRPDRGPGILEGLAVSAGRVEGRARVLLRPEQGLKPGEILVTVATDPGWTPAFVAAGGLVTEVGGWMTHGSVIAREYGLPAVVGVSGATQRIRDGQLIRVDGAEGWVQILDEVNDG